MMLLSGEPGIGKTRLASYAALGANADGFAVCWGACSEDLATPYEPWITVCSQLVEHAPEAALAGYAERFGGDIGRLARNLSRRIADAPAPSPQIPRRSGSFCSRRSPSCCARSAGSLPLLVVLDDFHWADPQSVALLKHVARSVETAQLQLLVTYPGFGSGQGRPADDGAGRSASSRRGRADRVAGSGGRGRRGDDGGGRWT